VILIATPTRDTVTAGFAADLVKLCRRHPDARFAAALGIYIANLRQSCVSVAQQVGASHILFLDSDMRFPEDTLERLLAADVDIVAANYVQRTMPEWWVARRNGSTLSSVGRTGLEPVASVGCGVMLIRMTVFDRIRRRPWFSTPYDDAIHDHLGEDLYFCREAQGAGFEVWIDHDLSQAVRHQGMVELGVNSHREPILA